MARKFELDTRDKPTRVKKTVTAPRTGGATPPSMMVTPRTGGRTPSTPALPSIRPPRAVTTPKVNSVNGLASLAGKAPRKKKRLGY